MIVLDTHALIWVLNGAPRCETDDADRRFIDAAIVDVVDARR